jgi:uncharacterized protein (AIM24 family)
MDVIDYEIFGNEMQYVEIELDPGEAAIGSSIPARRLSARPAP